MSADHTKYHLAPTGFWKKFSAWHGTDVLKRKQETPFKPRNLFWSAPPHRKPLPATGFSPRDIRHPRHQGQ
ncbi:hypothetical protein I314_05059 [Cryptococcus bacillisporus CA1873]|uniref:Uncharacterized protein n=2 Tax=Cryptococcus gattii TaxID=552467 RepID=A0A0D0VH72_CRYGA|nr:hypothetical protein I312_04864 [Cryptococcus bacillisporus CA1280]KIR59075.1 hypothetical protein I314_05059 [Cryptococcus bacillisporus CA1873]|eukprot:KIR59075.1 hypothetical protein I314_05059 [Cryptococcus gattii CA1873]